MTRNDKSTQMDLQALRQKYEDLRLKEQEAKEDLKAVRADILEIVDTEALQAADEAKGATKQIIKLRKKYEKLRNKEQEAKDHLKSVRSDILLNRLCLMNLTNLRNK